MANMDSDLLTISEVARYLGVSRSYVNYLDKELILTADFVLPSGGRRWRASKVEDYVEKMKQNALGSKTI